MKSTILSVVVLLLSLTHSAAAFEVGEFVGSVTDPARNRDVAYTVYFPEAFVGTVSVVVFSHGGIGSPTGHTEYGHFGSQWAADGFVAIHINHLASTPLTQHRIDRPLDVSFLLDQLQSAALPLPAQFLGTLDVSKFGHAGHSFGAYTSLALAEGDYQGLPNVHDPRIVAAAPVSPAGPGQFGGYDNGPGDSTWSGIDIPMFNLVGELEKDSNYLGTINITDWRLVPFVAYEGEGDKFQALLPGLDHNEMGGSPTPESEVYIPGNIGAFFDAYLRGNAVSACEVGASPSFVGQDLSVKADPLASIASECPNFAPTPVPALGVHGLALLALGLLSVYGYERSRAQ